MRVATHDENPLYEGHCIWCGGDLSNELLRSLPCLDEPHDRPPRDPSDPMRGVPIPCGRHTPYHLTHDPVIDWRPNFDSSCSECRDTEITHHNWGEHDSEDLGPRPECPLCDMESQLPKTGKLTGWAKVAGYSRKDLMDRRDKFFEGHQDSTEVLHTSAEGHTIRKLNSEDDHAYEADLADNCFRDHARDGNTHSFRDPDNIPVLSFAMDHGLPSRCQECDGEGEVYGGGDYQTCDECEGSGRDRTHPKEPETLRLYSVYGRGNTTPRDSDLFDFMSGLKEYGRAKGHTGFQFEHGPVHSFDGLDEMQERVKNISDRLPSGDVYLKVKDNIDKQRDEEGNLDLSAVKQGYSYHGSGTPGWSKEKPEPDALHAVYKTPFTKRRFAVDTGFTDFLEQGQDMPEEPKVWVKHDATFPKSALSLVSRPQKPTHFYIHTDAEARDNPQYYKREGMSGDAINGYVHDIDKRGAEVGSSRKDVWDTWEVHMDPDEANEHMVAEDVPQHPAQGKDVRVSMRKDVTIPWDKMTLAYEAGSDKVPELPTFREHEGRTYAEHRKPERLYGQVEVHNGGSWKDAHDLENTGIRGEAYRHRIRGLSTTKPNSPYGTGEMPVDVDIPNDPRYVEEVPKEESSGTRRRFWKLKPDAFIPREEYGLTKHREAELAPATAYLHINHRERDNPKVFTEQGIDLDSTLRGGYDERSKRWKMTTEPNGEGQKSSFDEPHLDLSPTQADIYEVDMAKVPNWELKGDMRRHEYGEGRSEGRDDNVLRVHQPNKSVTCRRCQGSGKQPWVGGTNCDECNGRGVVGQDKVLPWEAIVGLHSKAGVQPAEELKKRKLIAHKLVAEGWGDVVTRGVRAYE